MEVIYTNFSPDDKVQWKREEGKNTITSQHTVQKIYIKVEKQWNLSVTALPDWIKGVVHTFIGFFSKQERNERLDKAKESFAQAREKGSITKKSTNFTIMYKLSGEPEKINESELILLKAAKLND